MLRSINPSTPHKKKSINVIEYAKELAYQHKDFPRKFSVDPCDRAAEVCMSPMKPQVM
jgi:hypothetical protein